VTLELPTGTVTFLFTDIEGSTRLLAELGAESYADALSRHREIVREASSRHGGVEVDTQGDAFFIAFHTAPDALAAAAEAQRALGAGPVLVRMGIHTGTPYLSAEGYVGADVHRAARIAAAGHGGQVLVSSSTAELVDPSPLRDLGEHRLKDLTRPQQLHQLLIDDLPSDFPPLNTLDARPTNLPVQAAALIGRERELEETRDLLARARLLTLTGAGGTGKTRLAIQLAAEVLDEYDGVYFVDLADVHEPELVVQTVAQTLGVKERGGVELRDAVAGYLAAKRLLLVLDNVEQVVDAAPDVSRWLSTVSRSKMLATGRTPLRLAGEQEYPVPPLPGDAAVELFAERARAVRPGFALDGDRSVVAEICARLDSLPLAIELAAARVKLLPPPKLLDRLDQRLPLLTGGARDAPARHQTLRAAIDWSFGLLQADEQELFARLSVFAGGSTLEAAEAVCTASIDGLASLVEKSLLTQREETGGEPRFSMLETVREYARERLEERGEAEQLAERHADYFFSLAEETGRGAPSEDVELGRFLHRELDNLRRALGWLVASGDVERELRLATIALWSLWTRASLRELHGWLASALERSSGLDSSLRAEALGAAALAAANLGKSELARTYARESLELARERNDKRQIEWALRVLSFDEPDLAERRRLLRQCEALLLELGDEAGLAWVAYNLGVTSADEGDVDQARAKLEEAVALFRRLGKLWEATNAELGIGYVLVMADRHTEALPIIEGALSTAVELDFPVSTMEALVLLAAVRLGGDPAEATRLLAGARAIADESGLDLDPRFEGRVAEETEQRARERLGERFEREWETGSALTQDEAVALALGDGT
jgi:predicted ATPase/class 3 adenylate cyclase